MFDPKPRKMASMAAVREHWEMPYGVCFRCKRHAQVVRGHVIAHAAGGSGGVENLVPLCATCNKLCVPWEPGDERIAWAWMRMDAARYQAEFLKLEIPKEVAEWTRERAELPPEERPSIEDLIFHFLGNWSAGATIRSELWAMELAAPLPEKWPLWLNNRM